MKYYYYSVSTSLLFASLFIICISCVDYTTHYFPQKIDHFNFRSNGDRTFQQRYLMNDTWWDKQSGPVFFSVGSESSITTIWEHTGFITEIAPQFKALVLAVEHRYYGESLPYGKASFEGDNIGQLSLEQALADYAFLVSKVLEDLGAPNASVITFGGSYGGMVAAYMRFKFPNIVTGSISSSAPMYQLAGYEPDGNKFFQKVTQDFRDASPKCETLVRAAYNQLQDWADLGERGFQKISRYFHLCDGLETDEDFRHLLLWSRNAFVNAAMLDYPYQTSPNFPANPVKAMCDLILKADSPVGGLYAANGLWYNSSQNSKCFKIWDEYIECADPTGCGLGDNSKAWDYQVCTEMNLEASTDGVHDMFPVLPFTSKLRDEYCMKTWGVLPRRSWLRILYWENKISSATNIVFSNGDLDPWAPGGVPSNISDSVLAVLIRGGAHHLDLRASNSADPPSVAEARRFEIENIKKWISAR